MVSRLVLVLPVSLPLPLSVCVTGVVARVGSVPSSLAPRASSTSSVSVACELTVRACRVRNSVTRRAWTTEDTHTRMQ